MKRRTGRELAAFRRDKLRITQAELARICGLTASNMNKHEKMRGGDPVPHKIEMIVRLLGMSEDNLQAARSAIEEDDR